MNDLIKTESKHWLITKQKIATQAKDHSLFPYETGDAAKLIGTTPTELREAVAKNALLRGVVPPTAYLVNGKYYFFVADLNDFNNRKIPTDFKH